MSFNDTHSHTHTHTHTHTNHTQVLLALMSDMLFKWCPSHTQSYSHTHTHTHTHTQVLLALMSDMLRQVVSITESAALGAKEAVAASTGKTEGRASAPPLPPYFDSYQVCAHVFFVCVCVCAHESAHIIHIVKIYVLCIVSMSMSDNNMCVVWG